MPLTLAITNYLSVVTLALNSAVGRYLTVALERGNEAEANRIFNTSFTGIVCLACVVTAIRSNGRHIDRLLNVPAGYASQARWLMACTLPVLTDGNRDAVGVASFCRNRFDLSNSVSIGSILLRTAVVVAAFQLFAPSRGRLESDT